MEISRRALIKGGAIALMGLGTMPRFLVRTAAADAGSAGKKVLIAIFQRGAVDGLSMVVPHAEPNYYAVRPSIAIPRPKSGSADAAIDLDGFFGVHPALVERFKAALRVDGAGAGADVEVGDVAHGEARRFPAERAWER